MKHPSEIKFDDIDEIYVDDNGTSKADFKKYHVFIRTNDTYCLAIATFSSRKDAEKLLNEIRKVINE